MESKKMDLGEFKTNLEFDFNKDKFNRFFEMLSSATNGKYFFTNIAVYEDNLFDENNKTYIAYFILSNGNAIGRELFTDGQKTFLENYEGQLNDEKEKYVIKKMSGLTKEDVFFIYHVFVNKYFAEVDKVPTFDKAEEASVYAETRKIPIISMYLPRGYFTEDEYNKSYYMLSSRPVIISKKNKEAIMNKTPQEHLEIILNGKYKELFIVNTANLKEIKDGIGSVDDFLMLSSKEDQNGIQKTKKKKGLFYYNK